MYMRIRRLLATSFVGTLLALAACSGGSPLESTTTGPSAPAVGNEDVVALSNSGPSRNTNPQLVYCKPFDQATKSATIGRFGGTIKVGPHSLWIPPGALLSSKTITAKIAKNDYTNSVMLYPEGLKFIAPAVLTLSTKNCDRQTLLKPLQVVYTTDDLQHILDLLPSVNNPVNKTIIGTIRHFSRYAVAY
jgi:hypothetical protein